LIRFGHFTLEPEHRRLARDGEVLDVGPRAFDVLLALVRHRGRVVTKKELLDLVWAGFVVEEGNVQVQISSLRKLLGSDVITTVPGRGYQFTAAVDQDSVSTHPSGGAMGPLRGLAGETEHVCERAEEGTQHDLTETIPPTAQDQRLLRPNSAGTETHNLSIPLDSLVGRHDDIEELSRWLCERRLVTVVGPGGIGKTRVALAVAWLQVGRFPDGVWWVDLAAIASPRDIVAAVAGAAHLQIGSSDTATQLARTLSEREMLLVLDNCEHVAVDVAAMAHAILAGAPGTRLLATSRQLLQVKSEHVYRLDPLRIPAADIDFEVARAFSALALLDQRAKAIDQQFSLDASSLESAINLCRELDGMPLAIEMVAARLPVLGFAAVRSQLAALRSSSVTLPARQKTLRATIDWSHSLLNPEEQVVLRRLAVFVGAFTLDAARLVGAAGGINAELVSDALIGLVNKSMVQIERGEPLRYRLLVAVRDYAAESLAIAGETEDALHRHGEAMAALASQALNKSAAAAWLPQHLAHYGDLQVAFDRACLRCDAEVAAATGALLWELDDRRGVLAPAGRRSHAAHALLPHASPLARARLWNCVATWIGAADAPVPVIEAARLRAEAWRHVGDPSRYCWALTRLLAAIARTGDLVAAERIVEEMRAIEDRAGASRRPGDLRWARTMLNFYKGDARALESSARLDAVAAEQNGDQRDLVMAKLNLTKAALLAQDSENAVALAEEAVQAASVLNRRIDLGLAFVDLCAAHLLHGNVTSAVRAGQRALPMLIENDYSGFLFDLLALLAIRCDDLRRAAMLSGAADAWYAKLRICRTPIDARTAELVRIELDSRLPPPLSTELIAHGGQLPMGEAELLCRQLLGN
jgi:predicted ATPase/DNA-binding winged helix-turn-helix (wHTH) protein